MSSEDFALAEDFGKQLAVTLIARGIAKSDGLVGCSEEEIETLRLAQKVDFLPETYRQFLTEMGSRCDPFLDSTITYSELLNIKEDIDYDLKLFERAFRVPDDAFVFFDDGGIVFYYFHTADRNDDPPVYMFGDSAEEPVKLKEHLSEFFEDIFS